jgi:hypothetical protein
MSLEQAGEADAQRGLAVIRSRKDVLIFALATLVILIAAFNYGRSAQAAAERNQDATIDEENRIFCAGLGLIPATPLYKKCVDGAMVLRSRREERAKGKICAL